MGREASSGLRMVRGTAAAVVLLSGVAAAAAIAPAALAQSTAPAAGQPGGGGSASDLKAAIEEIKRRVEQQRQAAQQGSPPGSGNPADDLRAARDRIEGLAQTMLQLKNERDSLRGQLLQARDDLAKAQQRVQSAESERQGTAATSAGRITGLEKELAQARGRGDELTRQNADLAAARDQARQALTDREARLASGQQELERLRQASAAGDDARRSLGTEADGLRARTAELEAQLAKARSDAEQGQADAERRLAAEVDQLKGQLDQTRGQLDLARKESVDLRAVAASSVEEVRGLSEQLLAALAEKDRIATATAELSSSKALQDLQLAARDDEGGGAAPAAAAPRSPRAEATTALAVPDAASVTPAAGPPAAADDDARPASPVSWTKTAIEGTMFAVSSERLAPEASAPLAKVAALIRDGSGPVRIVGHTDAQGDPDANRRLSLKRAQSVRDYLVQTYKIDAARFRIDGKGGEDPIAPNDSAPGRRTNRRVEIFVAR